MTEKIKHGKWIHRDVYKRFKDEWQTAKCSECGLYHTTPYIYSFKEYPYCPNCGAYMLEDTNGDR